MKEIYTIGYSKFDIQDFINTLKKNSINAIADVRSSPFSQFKPEFNKDNLANELKKSNINYVFLGDYCGARVDDVSCYKNGKADYNLISRSKKFQEGLKRIRNGVQKYRIALMCAESDPITCHRDILICRNLKSPTLMIKHIINSDKIELNEDSEKRLLDLFKLNQNELFNDRRDLIEEAYNKQSLIIAYNLKYYEIEVENGHVVHNGIHKKGR